VILPFSGTAERFCGVEALFARLRGEGGGVLDISLLIFFSSCSAAASADVLPARGGDSERFRFAAV